MIFLFIYLFVLVLWELLFGFSYIIYKKLERREPKKERDLAIAVLQGPTWPFWILLLFGWFTVSVFKDAFKKV